MMMKIVTAAAAVVCAQTHEQIEREREKSELKQIKK
jgi:hypothetical protein